MKQAASASSASCAMIELSNLCCDARRGVAEMGAERGAGGNGVGDLRPVRGGVAEGDDLSPSVAAPADQGVGAGKFRGQGQQQDRPPQPRLDPLHQRRVGCDHCGGRVAAGVAVERAEERTLQMVAGHHQRAEPAAGDRRVEGGEPRGQHAFPRRDEGGQARRNPGAQHRVQRVVERVGGEGGVVEIDAREAVHLQVDEAGAAQGVQPWPIARSTELRASGGSTSSPCSTLRSWPRNS